MAEVLVTLTAAVAGLLVALVARWLLNYAEFRKLELAIPGPPSLPLLGNALTLATMTRENMMPTLLGLIGGRHELSRMSLINNLIVVASDPDDVAAVFKRREFDDKAWFFYSFMSAVVPNGLVQLNGVKWKEHRKALQPALARDVIDPYMHVFSEEAERFSRSIAHTGQVDVHDALKRPSVRIFMRTSMTAETLGPDQEQALRDAVDFLDQSLEVVNARSFSPWLWPNAIFGLTSMARQITANRDALFRYVSANILQRRSKEHEHTQTKECTDYAAGRRKQIMLDKMMQSPVFTDKDMMDETVTFLSASTDTVVGTLSFVFKMMTLRPDIQERVYAEVADVLGSGADARPVELHDLPRFQYMDQVIKETLRLLPTIPFVARQVRARTELAGKTVPAGSTLVLNILGIHHDPRHWPDPWHFDPERFAPGADEGRHPLAFVAFSAGARNCPGTRYAYMTVKTMLATVLRDHRLEASDDGVKDARDLKVTFNVTARIFGGTWVRFRPRTPYPADIHDSATPRDCYTDGRQEGFIAKT